MQGWCERWEMGSRVESSGFLEERLWATVYVTKRLGTRQLGV